jgi:hypothetical protein
MLVFEPVTTEALCHCLHHGVVADEQDALAGMECLPAVNADERAAGNRLPYFSVAWQNAGKSCFLNDIVFLHNLLDRTSFQTAEVAFDQVVSNVNGHIRRCRNDLGGLCRPNKRAADDYIRGSGLESIGGSHCLSQTFLIERNIGSALKYAFDVKVRQAMSKTEEFAFGYSSVSNFLVLLRTFGAWQD